MDTALTPPSARTRVVRLPARARYDAATIHAILDAAWVCHVAMVTADGPVVIPTSYWRVGDELMIHGPRVGRMVRALQGGAEASVAVTLVDGLVLARSAFHHSMNYRSVVLFGRARTVEGDEKVAALAAFIERIEPGRSAHVRPPSPAELDDTAVLAFPLTEASAKIRTGPPKDDAADMALPVWAGVVPLTLTAGEPQPDRGE